MQRLSRLDAIALKLGRFSVWGQDQREALTDNIDSDLEIMKQAILSLKVELIYLN